MGKLLDLLRGIPLPPDVESAIRIFDLQHEALEKKYNEIIQSAETAGMEHNDNTSSSDQPEGSQVVSGYTTQKITQPNDPTDDEAVV